MCRVKKIDKKANSYPLPEPLLSPSPAAAALTAAVPDWAKTRDFRCAVRCVVLVKCNAPSKAVFFINTHCP